MPTIWSIVIAFLMVFHFSSSQAEPLTELWQIQLSKLQDVNRKVKCEPVPINPALETRKCWEKASPSSLIWRHIRTENHYLCNRGKWYQKASYQDITGDYFLRKTPDGFEISIKVCARYVGSPENKIMVLKRLKEAVTSGCLNEPYQQASIKMSVQFDFDEEAQNCNQRIEVTDFTSRIHSKLWGILNTKTLETQSIKVEMPMFLTCPLYAHELGHLLGLPDRYPEKAACFDRNTYITSENNADIKALMSNAMPFSKLYPEDVRILLAAVCVQ